MAKKKPTTLEGLIASLQTNTYKPKTEAELQAIAENRYQSVYDQQRLQAQQGYETTNLALENQAEELGAQYDKQLQQSAENYAQAYSQAGRGMLGRGMQRSSYGAQVLSGVAQAGNEAANEIMTNRTRGIGNVEEQKTLLAQQLAHQLQQYSASEASDILAYIDELEGREYDRTTASSQYGNSLAMQIYQFANQEAQQSQAQQNWSQQQANWLKEFNENKRQFDAQLAASQAGRGRSGGGGSNTGKTPYQTAAEQNANAEGTYLLALLNNPAYNPTTGSNGYAGR